MESNLPVPVSAVTSCCGGYLLWRLPVVMGVSVVVMLLLL